MKILDFGELVVEIVVKVTAYDGLKGLAAIFNFLRTGYYYRSGGYIYVRVTYGYWWSTTAGSATYGHYLSTAPTTVLPQDNDYRGYGFAVRCVVREG